MIVDDPIIRFSPDDAPDLPELKKPKKLRQRKKRETPPPTDWRPHGEEW